MGKSFIDFLEVLFIGVGVFLLAWFFIAEPLEVNGESMEPTLRNKEQIITEKFTINFSSINRGDIVVVESPQKPGVLVIKRVIAVEGDLLSIQNGNVYVNKTRLNEQYLDENTTTTGGQLLKENMEITVSRNSYFVMGDNRSKSSDSRNFGLISKDKILGRAIMVYYPFENLRFLDHVDPLLLTSIKAKPNYAFNF